MDLLIAAYKAVIKDFSQAIGWEEDFHEEVVEALNGRLFEIETIWPFLDIVSSIEDEMPSGDELNNPDEEE